MKVPGSWPGRYITEGLLGVRAEAPPPSALPFPTGWELVRVGGRGLSLWECEPSSVNSW